LASVWQRWRSALVLVQPETIVRWHRDWLLFNLITDRYERRATVVTTNLAFAEWVTVFASDEKLTTALLDRLAHHATVITTKGKSCRMRKRRGREHHP
jgi:DNA replication protein DnaC